MYSRSDVHPSFDLHLVWTSQLCQLACFCFKHWNLHLWPHNTTTSRQQKIHPAGLFPQNKYCGPLSSNQTRFCEKQNKKRHGGVTTAVFVSPKRLFLRTLLSQLLLQACDIPPQLRMFRFNLCELRPGIAHHCLQWCKQQVWFHRNLVQPMLHTS